MAPAFLRVLTLLKGCTVYEPTIEEMWVAYKEKYGVHDGVDLCSEDESDDESEWKAKKEQLCIINYVMKFW